MKSFETRKTGAAVESSRLLYWIGSLELLLAFGLADAAVVAWSAGLMTCSQVLASAFTYILIASGTLTTVVLLPRESSDTNVKSLLLERECSSGSPFRPRAPGRDAGRPDCGKPK
jgi:hypothetical protein